MRAHEVELLEPPVLEEEVPAGWTSWGSSRAEAGVVTIHQCNVI